MQPLQLDFSSRKPSRRDMRGLVAMLAMLLLVAAMLLLHRGILGRIDQLEAHSNIGDRRMLRHTLPNETEQRETKAALDAQHALNLPWDELLGALEQAQAQNSKVHLLAVQPNTAKGEVILNGEARNFATLMEYAQSLRSQKVFHDVVLLNQRQVDENGRQRLEFTLSAGWSPGWKP